jgi:hypothetical protein
MEVNFCVIRISHKRADTAMKHMYIRDVHGSVHRNNILVYNSNKIHKS